MGKRIWSITVAILVVSVVIFGFSSAKTGKSNESVKVAVRAATAKEQFDSYVNELYSAANLGSYGLNADVFEKALIGYYNLKASHKLANNSSVITVIDFSKSSCEKRMWIVDLLNKTMLLNTWVAHGHGSGDNMATRFSDTNESHQSSLGFYVTDGTYMGKHGRSLYLDGQDAGFNSHARQRSVVLHAAAYVCQNTINQLGRIGRSFGCPAVSPELSDKIIDLVKGKNMIFINGNDASYHSKYLDDSFVNTFSLPVLASNNMVASR